MPFMHNMNFLRMGPHGMQGTPYGAGRYPFPHGMGGSSLAGMGGPLGMAGGGNGMSMGMGMGGGFGGGGDLGFANRGGMGMGMGMGAGMGMTGGGGISPAWWEMMMSPEDEEDDDDAFWDEEEGEMPDVFTSYLKNHRGKRKGHGFGGMLFCVSHLKLSLLALLKECKWLFNLVAVLVLISTLVVVVESAGRRGNGIELC